MKETHGRDDVKRILVSIRSWNQVMFLPFTSMFNTSVVKACVNISSSAGVDGWGGNEKKEAQSFKWNCILHTWGAGVGACSGGWSMVLQHSKVLPLQALSRHHSSAYRTRDRMKHVWTKIIYSRD